MFYSLIGRLVWHGLKAFMRQKYGPTYVPKPLLAGGTVAVGIAFTLAILKATRSEN
jgi:hypothetical protein